MLPGPARDEERRAAHRAKRAHRGIDTARDDTARALVQLGGARESARCGAVVCRVGHWESLTLSFVIARGTRERWTPQSGFTEEGINRVRARVSRGCAQACQWEVRQTSRDGRSETLQQLTLTVIQIAQLGGERTLDFFGSN